MKSTHSLLFLSVRVILCQKENQFWQIITEWSALTEKQGNQSASRYILILSALSSLFFSLLKRTLGCLDDGWYTKECGEYRKTNMYFETLNWTSFPWMWSILTILLCRNIYIYIYYNSVSKERKNGYLTCKKGKISRPKIWQ